MPSTIPGIKKLYVDVQTRYIGSLGYANLDRSLSGLIGKQKAMATQSKLMADSAARDAARMTTAFETADTRLTASTEKRAKLATGIEQALTDKRIALTTRVEREIKLADAGILRSTEARTRAQERLEAAANTGRITSYRRAQREIIMLDAQLLERQKIAADARVRMQQVSDDAQAAIHKQYDARVMAMDEQVALNQKRLQDAGIARQKAVLAANTASTTAANVGKVATAGAIASRAGSVAIGAGVLGLGAGYELIKTGRNWQTYVAQQISNSPMSPQESRAFQTLSLQMAKKTGANPQDIFLALRYGSEMGLNQSQDTRFLQSAIKLGLPTGGSAAVPASMMALATGMRNFPGLANNPNAIGNMVLAASQSSAGVNAAQFVSAIPRTLTIAGHIGGSNQFAQSLAMTAALTRSGLSLEDSQTQITNLIQRIMKPSPATLKFIAAQDKIHPGLNLAGDFGFTNLHQKGLMQIISQLHGDNLSPGFLAQILPNMRGYFGALGLTGNQFQSFMQIQKKISAAPSQNLLGTNMTRYMGLSSTETAKLDQQLHVLAITLGTKLLPPFNTLLKDDIIPLVKEFADFTKNNQGLVDGFIKLSPWLIAIGGGLKLVSGGASLLARAMLAKQGLNDAMIAGDVAAGGLSGKMTTLSLFKWGATATGIGLVAAAMLKVSANADKMSNAVTKLFTTKLKDIGATTAQARGDTHPFGLGNISIGDWITEFALGPAGLLLGSKLFGQQTGSHFLNPHGNVKVSTTSSPMPPTGVFPATHLISNFPSWRGGVGGVPFTGSSFGNFVSGPQNNFQNRNILTEWDPSKNSGYSEGTPATDAARVKWYQSKTILGQSGVIMDTDFLNNGKQGSQPIRLPGSSKDQWIFIKYVKDHDNARSNGGMAAVWQDPMGNRVLFWHMNPNKLTLKPGQKFHGGQSPMWSWEENGTWHMCIVTGPAGRKDMTVLTSPQYDAVYDKWKKKNSSPAMFGNVKSGSAAMPSNLPGTEGSVWGTIAGAAARMKNVSPYVLAGIGFAESSGNVTTGAVNSQGYGVFGTASTWGTSAKDQANAAAQHLQGDYAWTGTPQGQASMKAHMDVLKQYGFTNTTSQAARTFVALAGFNRGDGAWWTTSGPNTGPLYAQNVLSHAATYQKNAGANASGSKPQINYNPSTSSSTTPTADPIGAIHAAFGQKIDVSKMSPANRAAVKGQLIDYYWQTYMSALATINQSTVKGPARTALNAAALATYRKDAAHPFANAPWVTASTRPTTPAGWAAWYGTQAGNIGSQLSTLGSEFATKYGQNWKPGNLPWKQWHLATGDLDHFFKLSYDEARSAAVAQFPHNAAKRNAAISLAWQTYQKQIHHPFKYGPLAQSQAAVSGTGISPVSVVGSNKQLAVLEEQLRVLKHLDATTTKENQELKHQIRKDQAEIRRLKGGHHASPPELGITVAPSPGGSWW